MKVCFPVMENQGLESQVFGYFGSAPGFVVVDMASSVITAISNSDQIHQHGACYPVAGLGGHEVVMRPSFFSLFKEIEWQTLEGLSLFFVSEL